MTKNLVLLLATCVLILGALVGVDRSIGAFTPVAQQSGLLFPPNVKRAFATPEFSYTTQTNASGFRDRDFGPRVPGRVRILALGDSFTYGWGVEASESWPKRLEEELRGAGYDVEIANLGRPGGSPRNYAAIAERAIPMLEPDLVIVAVLQGDDLAQMAQPPQPEHVEDLSGNAAVTEHPRLRNLMSRAFPHLLSIGDASGAPALTEIWKKDAHARLAALNTVERERFESLDPEMRAAFVAGEINPDLLHTALSHPRVFLDVMNADSPNTMVLTREMARELGRVDAAASRGSAKAIVVSAPYGVYVSQRSYASRQRLGFELVPELLTADAGDEPIRRASAQAGLPFHTVTPAFRQVSSERNLFFELDGHFNPPGHALFAEQLAPIVRMWLSQKSDRTATPEPHPFH